MVLGFDVIGVLGYLRLVGDEEWVIEAEGLCCLAKRLNGAFQGWEHFFWRRNLEILRCYL